MGRLRGCVWLTAGLVVALLAGFVGFMVLNSASAQRSGQTATVPEVQVVVAARAVPVRSLLKPEDVQVRNVPVNAAPEGALRDAGAATGKVTLVDLYPGEVLLTQRLVDPQVTTGDGRMALVMAGDQVLMILPAVDLMSRAGVLKPGDHVDLLFSLPFPASRSLAAGGAPAVGPSAGLASFNLLENVTVSAMVAGNSQTGGANAQGVATGLLLTLSPQDALVLKYIKDAGGTMDVVLRAPGAEQPFTNDVVDMDYLINRYRIPAQNTPIQAQSGQ